MPRCMQRGIASLSTFLSGVRLSVVSSRSRVEHVEQVGWTLAKADDAGGT